MAKQLQLRRGTTAQHASFTGAIGEITIDTDKDTLVVHDGYTQGGEPLLREDLSNLGDNALALDKIVTGTHGQIFYYDATGQVVTLNPGNLYDVLICGGAGANPYWGNVFAATLLWSGSPTTSSVTANLSQSMISFKWLIFQSSEWANLDFMPVSIFRDGTQTMFDSYDTYHSYAKWNSDTQIYFASGQGNTTYKVWGMR